jgi:hypothetical protein
VTEVEIQDIITATLVSVKTQMIYVRNLHDAFGALYDAMAQVYPELDSIHKEEMKKIRPNPVQATHIQSLDELLERVEKLRRDSLLGQRLPGMSQ